MEAQERMIESQSFVMTNLRNGIDYLKATCKNTGEIQMNGCQWAEWAPWSVCSKVRAVLYCTVLYCTVLNFTLLYFTLLYFTLLYFT